MYRKRRTETIKLHLELEILQLHQFEFQRQLADTIMKKNHVTAAELESADTMLQEGGGILRVSNMNTENYQYIASLCTMMSLMLF